jgi:parallel beta-helix repeat protein
MSGAAVVAVTTVVSTLSIGVMPASANAPTPLSCGDDVFTNVTLSANITGCTSSNGLVIAADNVTLNLNGFTISGGPPVGGYPGWSGIDTEGHSGLTIKNGTVSGFTNGVCACYENSGTGPTITHITATGNSQAGILLYDDGSGAVVTNDTASNNTGDGTFPGDGIVVYGESGAVVTNDTASNNTGNGIQIDYSSGTVVANDITNGNQWGIYNFSSSSTNVSSSTANANTADGMYSGSPTTTFNKTTTNYNGGHGINATIGDTAIGAKARGNQTPPDCVNVTCQ